ncbi:iron-sulfur cluster assembly accessory protein [Rutstroemia sp. NJR-2017a WRK4]|nr:iron-sulfur cluster assembly accessory protein [Rutstroemia sp. NJR-2017a WRK4]
MSLLRTVAPLTSSSQIAMLFASSAKSTTTPPRLCQHLLRQFSSTRRVPASNKRKMQTSTWQTYTLNTLPPPAREAVIPETSITGGIPQVHDTRPPPSSHSFDIPAPKTQEQPQPRIALPEHEAQKPKPVKKRPRYNFVPLKKTISFTPRAVDALRELSQQPEAKLIKISVANRGCSGSAYDLKYVEKPLASDIVQEQDGVKVLIDPAAQLKIIGSTMDWVEDRLSAKFVFDNPNIDKSCGCGESFMTKDEAKARNMAE